MSVLPRAKGEPDREATRLVEQIRAYARRPPADETDARIQHVRNVHHIYDAALDAINVALAIANSEGPGHASYRQMQAGLGIQKDTFVYRVKQGAAVLAQEAAA
jgi:tellurite resistance protein